MKITTYFHADRMQLLEAAETAGLNPEASKYFSYADEVCVEMEVAENGYVESMAIKQPKKASPE